MEKELITLSKREIERLSIIHKVIDRNMTDSSQYNLTFDATWANKNPSMTDFFWDGQAKASSVGTTSLMASFGGVNSPWSTFNAKPASRDIIIIEKDRWINNPEKQ